MTAPRGLSRLETLTSTVFPGLMDRARRGRRTRKEYLRILGGAQILRQECERVLSRGFALPFLDSGFTDKLRQARQCGFTPPECRNLLRNGGEPEVSGEVLISRLLLSCVAEERILMADESGTLNPTEALCNLQVRGHRPVKNMPVLFLGTLPWNLEPPDARDCDFYFSLKTCETLVDPDADLSDAINAVGRSTTLIDLKDAQLNILFARSTGDEIFFRKSRIEIDITDAGKPDAFLLGNLLHRIPSPAAALRELKNRWMAPVMPYRHEWASWVRVPPGSEASRRFGILTLAILLVAMPEGFFPLASLNADGKSVCFSKGRWPGSSKETLGAYIPDDLPAMILRTGLAHTEKFQRQLLEQLRATKRVHAAKILESALRHDAPAERALPFALLWELLRKEALFRQWTNLFGK